MAGRLESVERQVRVEAVPRRGLRRGEAAHYVGVSPTKFDELVRENLMPRPKRIGGCVVWDIKRLDLAWDALEGDDAEASEWD